MCVFNSLKDNYSKQIRRLPEEESSIATISGAPSTTTSGGAPFSSDTS